MAKCAAGLALAMLVLSVATKAEASVFPSSTWLTKRHVAAGDWRLDVAVNHFSGSLICRLRSRRGRMRYQAGAVGFAFNKGWHVGDATYRIDNGVSRSTRADFAALIARAAPIDSGSMDNPSGGVVWIPYDDLAHAISVTIQARPDRQPRTFRLTGLKGLYATAVARGCRPESRFVR